MQYTPEYNKILYKFCFVQFDLGIGSDPRPLAGQNPKLGRKKTWLLPIGMNHHTELGLISGHSLLSKTKEKREMFAASLRLRLQHSRSTACLDVKWFWNWPHLVIIHNFETDLNWIIFRMWNNPMGFNGNAGFPPIQPPPANPSQQVGERI